MLRVLHVQVLPAHAERFAISAWYHHKSAEQPSNDIAAAMARRSAAERAEMVRRAALS